MPKKKSLIAVAALAVFVLLAAGAWYLFKPAGVAGEKTITVEVIAGGGSADYTVQTDAEFLRGALEDAELVEGDESEYGLFVRAVAGIPADEAKQEWWCFTKDGGTLNTGIDTTPIADGEHFEATLMVGW